MTEMWRPIKGYEGVYEVSNTCKARSIDRHDITLEVSGEPYGPGCWYISTPGYNGICPIGLFVKI